MMIAFLSAPLRWALRPLTRRHAAYIGCLTNEAIDALDTKVSTLTGRVNDLACELEDARSQIDEHAVGGPAIRAGGGAHA